MGPSIKIPIPARAWWSRDPPFHFSIPANTPISIRHDSLPRFVEACTNHGFEELEVIFDHDYDDKRNKFDWNACFDAVAKLTRLQSLTLRCRANPTHYHVDLGPVLFLRSLHHLQLSQMRATGLGDLAYLPNLRSLVLDDSSFDNKVHYDWFGELSELTYLCLSSPGLQSLDCVTGLKSLREIRLGVSQNIDTLAPLAQLPELTSLEFCNLYNVVICPDKLLGLDLLTNLKRLDGNESIHFAGSIVPLLPNLTQFVSCRAFKIKYIGDEQFLQSSKLEELRVVVWEEDELWNIAHIGGLKRFFIRDYPVYMDRSLDCILESCEIPPVGNRTDRLENKDCFYMIEIIRENFIKRSRVPKPPVYEGRYIFQIGDGPPIPRPNIDLLLL